MTRVVVLFLVCPPFTTHVYTPVSDAPASGIVRIRPWLVILAFGFKGASSLIHRYVSGSLWNGEWLIFDHYSFEIARHQCCKQEES